MPVSWVINENCCIFIIPKKQRITNKRRHDYRKQSYIIIQYDRYFLQVFFDTIMSKYTLRHITKRTYHRTSSQVKDRNHTYNDTFL